LNPVKNDEQAGRFVVVAGGLLTVTVVLAVPFVKLNVAATARAALRS